MASIRQWHHVISHSLSRQLLTGFGISLITVGLATLGINYKLVHKDLEQQVYARAKSIAQTLEFSTEGLLESQSAPILQRIVQNYATLPAIVEVAVVDPSGGILSLGPNPAPRNTQYKAINPDLSPYLEEASKTGTSKSLKTVLNSKTVLTYVLPFSSPLFNDSGRRGNVIVMVDLQQMKQDTWQIFLTSTTTMTVGILFILAAMWLLLRQYVLSPLARLNEAVLCSRNTDQFLLPKNLPKNEISFLATTFQRIFEQGQQAEAELRESETKERENTQQLAHTLQELQEAQSQLIQSEKMAGLGQMVAGVAHEINNPVNFIHGNLNHVKNYTDDLLGIITLYQEHFPDPPDAIKDLIEAVDLDFLQEDLFKVVKSMQLGTHRIREIVISLRNFSRLDESDVKAVDLHEGLESTLIILQNRLKVRSDKPDIEIIKKYGKLPLVECHASQINQVFMNILANAIDALKQSHHPTPQITIQTEQHADDCIIQISDNGVGIPEESLGKIFDPFFTTKPIGEGTGLGLSVSYRIIENHRGMMKCTSKLGQGTEFYIRLPIVQP